MKGRCVARSISNIAISYSDYEKFGCPVCMSGSKRGCSTLSAGVCSVFTCYECGVSYIVCSDVVDKSTTSVNGSYLKIFDHPNKSWFQIKYMIQALKNKNYELYSVKQKEFVGGCNNYIWQSLSKHITENVDAWRNPQSKENVVIRMLNGVLNELSKSKG
jgi:hypothetical protein